MPPAQRYTTQTDSEIVSPIDMLHSPSFNYTRLSLLRGSLFTAHVQHLTIQITLNSKLGRFIQCNEHVTIHLTVFQFISNQVTFTIDLPKFLTATEFITIGVTIITIHFFLFVKYSLPFFCCFRIFTVFSIFGRQNLRHRKIGFPRPHSCKFFSFSPPRKFFCNFTITLLQNSLCRCKITASY